MRRLSLLAALALAACDHIPILDDINDALSPEHEVVAETTGPWKAGGTARVSVLLTRPGTDLPVEGRVAVEMDGERLAAGAAGENGRAELVVRVPEKEGRRRVQVWSKTRFNTRRDSLAVAVLPGNELYFSLDRPLAQPGQEVHLRALAFKPDRTADAGREVTFEIRDPASNRVLRERAPAGEFGVAHATFRLADEVLLGEYTATARAGTVEAARAFLVKRYALPKFRIDLVTDKAFVLPGEPVGGSVRAAYVFGNPVGGARILLHAEARSPAGEVREIARSHLTADESGRAGFSIELPEWGSLLRLTAEVADGAGHAESAAHVIPIARAPLLVTAVPVAGRIVPGLDNEVDVFVTSPGGGPVEAEVSSGGAAVRTSALGFAKLSVREPRVVLVARDGGGRSVERSFEFPAGSGPLVSVAKRAPRAGTDLLATLRSARDGRFKVRLRTDRGYVEEKEATVSGGRGSATFALPGDLDGLAVVESEGSEVPLWVRGTRRLSVQVTPSSPTVRPGDEISLRFRVTDGEGRPVRSALGVSVLDEALLGLAEVDPESELASFAAGGLASGHAARALWAEEDEERCEVAAALLLAGRRIEGRAARFSSRRGP